jgi:hypothetical protein
MKKYGTVKILMAHMHIARQTPKNLPPLAHTTTHNTEQKKHMNIVTMVPTSHRLPAALILQVSAIVVRRAIDHDHRNTVMYF